MHMGVLTQTRKKEHRDACAALVSDEHEDEDAGRTPEQELICNAPRALVRASIPKVWQLVTSAPNPAHVSVACVH